jgi:hypothetical protein
MNPIEQYYARYRDIRAKLKDRLQGDSLPQTLAGKPAAINNLFMAGMGMSTLFLRMGAVIQLSEKLHDGNAANDALFLKQVMDNLRETLPSDTNWKNMWYASMGLASKWEQAIPRDHNKNTMLDRFVTFRNKFVHQYIRVIPEHAAELNKGLFVIDEMASLYALFKGGEVVLDEGLFYWKQNTKPPLLLHPFVQEAMQDGLPYIFQGLYEQKTKAKFINTVLGNETPAAENQPLHDKFQPIQQALRGGAGQIFDHTARMKYYLECFVGREREVLCAVEWAREKRVNQVLPIYGEAGMGKGALTAGIIDRLMNEGIPVMYHYCGSGMSNSLHAILYHFILQGRKMPGMNGAGVWKVDDEAMQRKLVHLPSRYFDAIMLFQRLLAECYAPTKKYEGKPLVIVIDGLDEAAVANNRLKISDWFYTYNDKDEPEEDWKAPEHVNWIFTYRSLPDKAKQGFQLDGRFAIEPLELLQPLQGLREDAVRTALETYELTEDYVKAVLEKGAVA